MDPSYFLPASQPTTSTPSYLFPEFLQGSSSLEPQHYTYAHTQMSLNVNRGVPYDLNLPPNALGTLAQNPSSGRLPSSFNGPAGQPVRTVKTVAAAKRTTARSHSQQNTWKLGSASACARGVSAPNPVSLLPEVAQSQPPPIKSRARRAAKAARVGARETTSFVLHQPAIATPSSASQQKNSTSATQVAASQGEPAPPLAYVGFSNAAMSSTASGKGRGESQLMPSQQPFSWATATAAEISLQCEMYNMPLNLIEQVLPRLRAFLEDSKHPATTQPCNTSPAQSSALAIRSAALALHEKPCPQSADGSGPSTAQLLASFSAPAPPATVPSTEQPERAAYTGVQASAPAGGIPGSGSTTDTTEWWGMMEGFAWAPETGRPTAEEPTAGPPLFESGQPVARTQTYEELGYLLQEQGSAAFEQTGPTQGAGMGGMWAGDFDLGDALDGWEGWAGLGCPDKL